MKQSGISALTLAGFYLSALIGAGFATGREVFVYFAAFGGAGACGIVVSFLLLAWAGARILHIAQANGLQSAGDLLRLLAGRRAAPFLNLLLVLFVFFGYVAMVAGLRGIAASALAPFLPGGVSGFLALLSVCAVSLSVLHGGVMRFAAICRVVTPVLVAGITGTALWFSLFRAQDAGLTQHPYTAPRLSAALVCALALRTLLYVGYNLLFAVGVLSRVGRGVAAGRTSTHGALLGAALFAFGTAGIYAALLHVDAAIAQGEMPLVALMQAFGSWPGRLFAAVLAGAMLLCAAANLAACTGAACSFTDRDEGAHARTRRERRVGTALAVLAVPLSYIGFGNVITVIYPIFGFAGIFLLLILAQTGTKHV